MHKKTLFDVVIVRYSKNEHALLGSKESKRRADVFRATCIQARAVPRPVRQRDTGIVSVKAYNH